MGLHHLIIKTLSDLSFNGKSNECATLKVKLKDLIEQKQGVSKRNLSKKLTSVSANSGNYKSKLKGRGIELEEIRPYNFGDDIRDIDWRVTARKQSVYTKLYNQEKDIDVYVIFDFSASMMFGTMKELKSVTACKVLASVAWRAFDNSDRFGAIINDGTNCYSYKSNNSRNSILSIFNKLVNISKRKVDKKEFVDDISFEKTLKMAKSVIKSGSIVYVISDFINFDDMQKKYISYLVKSNRVSLINIYDEIEQNPPKANQYKAHIGDEDITFDSSSKGFKLEYISHFNKKNDDLISFANKFKCKYFDINNNIPINEQLDFLR
jgi:hypothetical protein